MAKIFISYRREDSQHQADRLHAALSRKIPKRNIFIDVDNIPVGVDFAKYLDQQVSQCDVLLALIGPDWLEAKDQKTGQRRLDDPRDFVRIEIASALKRGIAVAPVLLDGVPIPPAHELPDDLSELTRRHGVEVRRLTFESDIRRLIRGLNLTKPAARSRPAARSVSSAASPTGRLQEPARWAGPAVALAILGIGVAAWVGNLANWRNNEGLRQQSSVGDHLPDDPSHEAALSADATTKPQTRPPSETATEESPTPDPTTLSTVDAQHRPSKPSGATLATEGPAPDVDTLARKQANLLTELEAWKAADGVGTSAAYQAYLKAWPDGLHAEDARAAVAKLNRPSPFAIQQLPPQTKVAVEEARRAQNAATRRASAARLAAYEADSLRDRKSIVGANGDLFDAQIANGAPNGLGVRTRGAGVNAGDRYRGELHNGQAVGVGVYEFADNNGNANARAARYEGEHAGDTASGLGVFYWHSGDFFTGMGAGGGGVARGVLTYANGQRYEGEMLNGQRHGHGVLWAADGSLIQGGRWERGELVEPVSR